MTYSKPLPQIDERNRPYWDGLREGQLRLPRCEDCGKLRYTPYRLCPSCGSERTSWARLSGKGTVWSACRFHQVYFEGFRAETPYSVVLVELDEGVKVYSNLVGNPSLAEVGQRVEAVFEPATAEVTLLKFRPVDPA